MGFFSSTTTYVSSTVYNLAGDIDKRPQYLKSLVVSSTFDDSSISESIHNGYFNGPGMRLRHFFNWSVNHYDEIGVPGGNLGSALPVDADTVQGEIPTVTGSSISVQYVRAGVFDYSYWAEQYVFEHHPDRIGTGFSADMNDAGLITILYEDLSTESFTPTDAVVLGTYIYAIYNLIDDTTHEWSTPKMFIYHVGSGNAVLDGLVAAHTDDGEYVPFIPVRLNNKFINEIGDDNAYKLAKKAYLKSTGGKLDKLIAKINDNESIGDIDYAYVMFGVSLNTKERSSREYLFRFFDKCRIQGTAADSDFAAQQAFTDSVNTWAAWQSAQSDPANPLYGTAEPTRAAQPALGGNEIHIKSSGTLDTNLDIKISWTSITETHGTGLKTSSAKKGQVWITYGAGGDADGTMPLYGGGTFWGIDITGSAPMFIHWQVDDNHWRTLTITGLLHKNLIYKTKSVDTKAIEALQDTEESGFIVPLHMETVREMSLVSSTQMMTAAAYVVFNCYKVVKKKWYQTWWFSVILFIAIVAITIATAGTGTAPAASIGASIVAAVGITGIVAVIVTAIINTLVAMIVAKLLMAGSVAVLGKKWGALIGSILTFAVTFGVNSIGQGISFGQAVQNLTTNVPGIMQMTSAVGNGITGFIQGDTLEIMHKTADYIKKSKADLDAIHDLWKQNIGNTGIFVDPLALTDDRFDPLAYVDALQHPYIAESRDDFLARTLLTGSDICEMTMDMITNFAAYTLKTDLPL